MNELAAFFVYIKQACICRVLFCTFCFPPLIYFKFFCYIIVYITDRKSQEKEKAEFFFCPFAQKNSAFFVYIAVVLFLVLIVNNHKTL